MRYFEVLKTVADMDDGYPIETTLLLSTREIVCCSYGTLSEYEWFDGEFYYGGGVISYTVTRANDYDNEFGYIEWVERYNSYVWVDFSKKTPSVKQVDIKKVVKIEMLFQWGGAIDDGFIADKIDGYWKTQVKCEDGWIVTYEFID